MLRIAICARDAALKTELTDFVARYATDKGVECTAKAFDNESDLMAAIKDFDAAFVDAVADEDYEASVRKMRGINASMPIVLIATGVQFSIKGKGVDIMDLMVAPVSYYAFATMIDRVQARIVRMDVPTVALMTKQGARRISVDEITYMEGSAHHVLYHTTAGDIRVRGTLNDAEKKLTADRFFRLNGYLINLGQVDKVSGADVYVGNACLPLPRNKKAEFLDSLLSYMNRG